jgi:hypothetical protein
MATTRSIRSWEGYSLADVDEWTDTDFFAAWTNLKNILPEPLVLRGICPVTGNDPVRWAALAWSPGQCWRGLGITRLDAVVALTDLVQQEATPNPEQASPAKG